MERQAHLIQALPIRRTSQLSIDMLFLSCYITLKVSFLPVLFFSLSLSMLSGKEILFSKKR
jgi:hypothetical protein